MLETTSTRSSAGCHGQSERLARRGTDACVSSNAIAPGQLPRTLAWLLKAAVDGAGDWASARSVEAALGVSRERRCSRDSRR
jgi:hypothetical protein